jgi:adenine phosphoribosyltransferase
VIDIDAIIGRVPDHPKPGIVFYDLMPVFANPAALDFVIGQIAEWARPRNVDIVLGAESRGFILGGGIAQALGAGFVAARKPGRLPGRTVGHDYELEYGTDRLEIQVGAVCPGQRVLIHDDLLATGGTSAAKIALVESQGGVVVGTAFVIELEFLDGRRQLVPHDVFSLVTYDSEALST